MSDEENKTPQMFVDFLPNHATHPKLQDSVRDMHRRNLERDLENIISRQGQLPQLMVFIVGDYVNLLTEARNLFCYGYFYACVAMCGIVTERVMKDILRNHVCTLSQNVVYRPSDKAFDQLEYVDMRSITNFLAEAGLIDSGVKTAATKLGELRNKYAHARGQDPQEDALKAIQFLHKIIDGTFSVLKDHTIKDGKIVPKKEAEETPEESSAT